MHTILFKRIFEGITIRNMKQKITLNIDAQIIHHAKAYANSRGESLSQLIETYLYQLSESPEKEKIPDDILRWKGIIKLNEGLDFHDIIREEISKKQEL